ncbi:MAG: 50S ribosomal protein L1 [Planctomycetaceae bacterium]|jgi:large subunit ribosomal protein L1|nr:50S ribosomal protein L1 [Planctomycetaceae bacterium]MBT6153936.1 50S ribosomal protein L1 [Planctomycetaceae bacterium]MBT6483762.1 50S ribosomal protein L1 [Planctomycetaceae bacterium]MBT6494542.1 50S ribosomal protein L1 [Planctomycetaceae bacterium]
MAKQSKRFTHYQKQVDELGAVDLSTAVGALKGLESSLPKGVKPFKFDQSVELSIRLGVDPKQADQIVRGSIVLPHGIGKTQRVLVFAQGDNVAVAEEAGADFVGGKELADKIKDGWIDFDVAIATPDMMGVVGPLGRVLGPRGLMPSPRAGTVTQEVAKTVQEYRAGKVEFRCDDGGNVHCVVGKMSFEESQLQENIEALLKLVDSLRPTSAKGVYVRNIALSGTMTPGISVAV